MLFASCKFQALTVPSDHAARSAAHDQVSHLAGIQSDAQAPCKHVMLSPPRCIKGPHQLTSGYVYGRHLLQSWRTQLARLFRPHIEKESIIFRRLSLLRNGSMQFRHKALIVLDAHYLLNVDAIEHIEAVHDCLKRQQQPVCEDTRTAQGPCPCRLQLLIFELSRSPKGQGLASMMCRRMAELLPQPQQAYQPNPDSPVSHVPAAPFADEPQPFATEPQPKPAPCQPSDRARQPVAPARPDAINYGTGVRTALQNAPHQQRVPRQSERSGAPPSDHTCRPEADLVASNMELAPGHLLYLPEGDQVTGLKIEAGHALYQLLEKLIQQVFAQGITVGSINIFFDDRGSSIAFNLSQKQLFFNAYHDPRDVERHAREQFWFHKACHVLAHQYEHAHCSRFAETVGAITYSFSKRGRQFLERTSFGV